MDAKVLQLARSLVPPLTSSLRKGHAGRVAVIGGSLEVRIFVVMVRLNFIFSPSFTQQCISKYTGAPFLSAMTALRTGADLVHVIASPLAAPAIKAYSPDLIVHPLLEGEKEDDSGKRQSE